MSKENTSMNRKTFIIVGGAFLVSLYAFAPRFLTTSVDATVAHAELNGAIFFPAKNQQLELRAYKPNVAIKLSWEEEQSQYKTKLIVHNVMADQLQAKASAKDGYEASVDVAKITETVVELTIESDTRDVEINLHPKPKGTAFRFAAIGDNQGRNEVLRKIIEEINGNHEVDFLIHLGDLVPSGRDREYEDFFYEMDKLQVPYYTVPGNHDVRSNGREIYQETLAPLYYQFELGDARYIFLDTADFTLSEEQFVWLAEQINTDSDCYLFMHVPSYDPRGRQHSFRDLDAAARLRSMTTDPNYPIKAVFHGHVHMSYVQEIDETLFVTSGGAGGSLYAAPDEGGFYHYTIVSPTAQKIDVEVFPIEIDFFAPDLVILKEEQDLILTMEELKAMEHVSGESSFQNQFGNIRGHGKYSGILISDLLTLVGGIEKDEVLEVYAVDGYKQEFFYENVYPEEHGWLYIQGPMVLATSMNGEYPPEWQEGYRLVFLPKDGLYSNEDSSLTSRPEQGFHEYPSAGARWVRSAVRLEVHKWE
ncbi:metallophosphoesterase [Desulfuribacillus alkaliarsenatis]|uniref:Calcineurin-like phosphoesterase domain-containing protein n=1 Tax=Desulfuribacillus alkaliarsenatis TaxID=766136 RepID=A0A1E5FZC2_9FIRM|nr:metallophosphoesterase [Desulfuribacillus alkaliarsenatis]OEF95913.1 hypothetical protein BHF68_11015 [Desulfuribacillus alkaliarsenatis]